MKPEMDKSLFFLFLSFVCIWLVLDVAVGKDRLGSFLATIFPFMDSSGSSGGSSGGENPFPENELETKEVSNNSSNSAAKYSVPGFTSPLEYAMQQGVKQ